MDCACLLLLYMDRELVWRSVILFSQSLPSALLFCGEEYLQSSLHIFQVLLGWLGWMTLNHGGDESPGASPSLSSLSWRKTTTFSRHTFHVKNTLFSHPNLFMSLIFPPHCKRVALLQTPPFFTPLLGHELQRVRFVVRLISHYIALFLWAQWGRLSEIQNLAP